MGCRSRSDRALVAGLVSLALGAGCATVPARHDAAGAPVGDAAERSLRGLHTFHRYDNFDGDGLVSLLGASLIVGGAAAYVYLERLKGRGGLRPAGGGDGLPDDDAALGNSASDAPCGAFAARADCAAPIP